MRFRFGVWLAPLLVVLVACSRPSAPPGPPTQEHVIPPAASALPTEVPAKTSEPTPAPRAPGPTIPEPTPADFCEFGKEPEKQTERLRQYVVARLAAEGGSGLAERIEADRTNCLRVERSTETPLYLVAGDRAPWPSVVVWASGSGWRVAAVEHGVTEYVELGRSILRDGRPDLILQDFADGTGHFGSLLHFTVESDGTARSVLVTDRFAKSGFGFLAQDLVLVTYREVLFTEYPSSCYGCTPSLEQQLLRWDGKTFTMIDQRMTAYPDLTLNRLRLALSKNEMATAARLVSDPALLTQARQVLDGSPTYWANFEPYNSGLIDLEWYNWATLPEAHRKSLPPELQHRSYVVERPDGRYALQMKRTPSQWILTNIQALKPGEIPADAPKK